MNTKPVKTAIVTGAARGIGAAIAERLALGGHAVAMLDIDADACIAAAKRLADGGARVLPLMVDVASEDAISVAVAKVNAELGAPMVLINNAGFARDMSLDVMTAGDWDAVHAVHLRGAFLLSRAVQPFMAEHGWGRIVNIASTSALGHADRVNYCAAKAGLIGLTRALAVELGPRGVTANAVAPGLIVTRMTEATASRNQRSLQEHIELAAAALPVRRVGRPEDIAAAVAYFASEDAGFVTGQTLYVSGGPAS